MLFIATLKFKAKKDHDPRFKVKSFCALSSLCTDSTGAHHCILVKAPSLAEAQLKLIDVFGKKTHITRIEKARILSERNMVDYL